jgi:hypothetical protein
VFKVIRTMLFCALAFCAATAHAGDTFPRTAAYLIGNPRNYEDPEYQEKIAKVDLAILSVWPGWERTHGTTLEEVTRRLKAINPRIKVFHYFLPESLRYPADPAVADLGAKLDAQKWWLYNRGSGPTKVLSDFGRDTYILNLSNFTPTDSSGRRLNTWLAEYAHGVKMKPNPSLDGIFLDNIFWKPRRDGDWNRDGVMDDSADATVRKWYREGYVAHMSRLRELMPDKLQIANIADWGQADAALDDYDQLLQGGILEGLIGTSYSAEKRSWAEALRYYRKAMGALAPPKLGIFHQFGASTDYQGFRYGLTTSMLDDGLYAFTDDDNGYSGIVWFDELDVKLGRATGAPPTVAWQKGVWRRDFEYGIALVNPKGNGPVEVTLEHGFRKIAGNQDRAVNNGQVVSKVSLRDRDGIILMKMQRRPKAPGNVKVSTSR